MGTITYEQLSKSFDGLLAEFNKVRFHDTFNLPHELEVDHEVKPCDKLLYDYLTSQNNEIDKFCLLLEIKWNDYIQNDELGNEDLNAFYRQVNKYVEEFKILLADVFKFYFMKKKDSNIYYTSIWEKLEKLYKDAPNTATFIYNTVFIEDFIENSIEDFAKLKLFPAINRTYKAAAPLVVSSLQAQKSDAQQSIYNYALKNDKKFAYNMLKIIVRTSDSNILIKAIGEDKVNVKVVQKYVDELCKPLPWYKRILPWNWFVDQSHRSNLLIELNAALQLREKFLKGEQEQLESDTEEEAIKYPSTLRDKRTRSSTLLMEALPDSKGFSIRSTEEVGSSSSVESTLSPIVQPMNDNVKKESIYKRYRSSINYLMEQQASAIISASRRYLGDMTLPRSTRSSSYLNTLFNLQHSTLAHQQIVPRISSEQASSSSAVSSDTNERSMQQTNDINEQSALASNQHEVLLSSSKSSSPFCSPSRDKKKTRGSIRREIFSIQSSNDESKLNLQASPSQSYAEKVASPALSLTPTNLHNSAASSEGCVEQDSKLSPRSNSPATPINIHSPATPSVGCIERNLNLSPDLNSPLTPTNILSPATPTGACVERNPNLSPDLNSPLTPTNIHSSATPTGGCVEQSPNLSSGSNTPTTIHDFVKPSEGSYRQDDLSLIPFQVPDKSSKVVAFAIGLVNESNKFGNTESTHIQFSVKGKPDEKYNVIINPNEEKVPGPALLNSK